MRNDFSFKQTQTQSLTIINSIKNNIHNSMAKKDKSKFESTLKNYNDPQEYNFIFIKNLEILTQKKIQIKKM